jgi:hypothetical protein
MTTPHRLALLTCAAVLAGSLPALRADDAAAAPAAPAAADAFVPPTPEAAAAAGLLPPDKVIVGKKHSLLDRWTKAFGLSDEQRLWIEPQLHAEEGLSKPVLAYKALTDDERQQILLIMKLAARRQVMVLLTPAQQKLMQEEIATTKANGR